MHLKVAQKKAVLSRTGQRIKITLTSGDIYYYPLKSTRTLVVKDDSVIEAGLLGYCLQNHLSIVINGNKQSLSCLHSASLFSERTGIKLACYALTQNKALALTLAKQIITRKIKKQSCSIAHLSYVYNTHNIDTVKAANHQLSSMEATHTLSQLLGVEGAAAAVYFRALRHFMPAWCGFKKRQRRPPPDAANAMLSLAYTMSYQLITRELFIAGFAPLLGVLHQPSDYRHSLSCDLLELIRTDIDKWVVKLLHQQLTPAHFEYSAAPKTVLLNQLGKQLFYPAWFAYQAGLGKKVQRLLQFIKNEVVKHVPQ